MKNVYYAAVDIGGTKITVSLANRDSFLIKLYQPVILEGDVKTLPRQVTSMVKLACNKASINPDKIRDIAVSTASPFLLTNSLKAIQSPNLCGGSNNNLSNNWQSIPLEEELSHTFPNVLIGNDCVTAAVAEHLFGAGIETENMIYVTWSTGIGAGIICDGRLLEGKNGNAGHGGHIFAVEDGPECGCGNRGDLESLVSGRSLEKIYGKNARALFDDYHNNNPKAIETIDRAVRLFARGLASFNALLDTEIIIIGGSVFLNNQDILQDAIESEFFKSFPAMSNGVKILPSKLHSYLGDIAAMSLLIKNDPEWVKQWRQSKPWKQAPTALVF